MSAFTGTSEVRLTRAGLRVTRQRVAVLEAVRAGEHLDVDTVVTRARQSLGTISTQAVYDALRALEDAGLVHRLEPAGLPALFEIRVGDNHHHAVCRSCRSVFDIDCAVGEAPCLDPSQPVPAGFRVDAAEVIWWGLCATCQLA